jgi:hypothetical protein
MTSAAHRRIGKRLTLALGFLAATALPFLALARDPAPPVPVEVASCGDDIPPAVRERLAVEVEVLWRESSSPPEMASLRVGIRCEGDMARIEVSATAESSRSSVDLTGLDREARARLLALKATELIHVIGERTWAKSKSDTAAPGPGPSEDAGKPGRTDAQAASPPVVDSSAATESEASPPGSDQGATSAPQRVKDRSTISAGALALFAGRPLAYVVGPSLSGTLSLMPRVSLRAEGDGTFGKLHQSDRSLQMRGASGLATLLIVGTINSVSWSFGAGGRLGYLQLTGEPGANASVIGKSSSGMWAGPLVLASMSYPLGSSRGFVELGAEGGVVTLPIGALVDQSQRFYTLDGPWLGLHASLGLDLAHR